MCKSGRSISLVIAITAIAALLCPAAVCAQSADVTPLWGPYLTGVGETGVTVNWKTAGETAGAVEYAAAEDFDGNYDKSVTSPAAELHHVSLAGLQPDTSYRYRVRVGSDYTADHTFTTLGGDSFTFVVYGDTREQLPAFTQLERHKLVADRIAAERDVAFVIHTGDLVTDGADLAEWGRFFDSARLMLYGMPVFPVAGNHEYNSSSYYEIFGVNPYYSFDCAAVHFAMLDSNDGADLAAEADWLTADLAGAADLKFVVCHHPLYSSDPTHPGGNPDLQNRWEPAFIEGGVSAVFNAHVHVYERCLENNINYVTLGNGGAPGYSLSEEKIPGYRNSLEHSLGYARITVSGSRAEMDVIRVADVSEDNSEVLKIYPPDTVFETVSLGAASPAGGPPGGFSIAPPALEVTLDGDESSPVYVHITSRFDGELTVGTEGVPFRVGPEKIAVGSADTDRVVELTVYDDPSVSSGEYSGKLTFLAATGSNLAFGIKLSLSVKKESQGFVAEFLGWFGDNSTLGKIVATTGKNYIIVVAVAGVVIALAIGVFIGRKTKKL
jgi:hypothetical protein